MNKSKSYNIKLTDDLCTIHKDINKTKHLLKTLLEKLEEEDSWVCILNSLKTVVNSLDSKKLPLQVNSINTVLILLKKIQKKTRKKNEINEIIKLQDYAHGDLSKIIDDRLDFVKNFHNDKNRNDKNRNDKNHNDKNHNDKKLLSKRNYLDRSREIPNTKFKKVKNNNYYDEKKIFLSVFYDNLVKNSEYKFNNINELTGFARTMNDFPNEGNYTMNSILSLITALRYCVIIKFSNSKTVILNNLGINTIKLYFDGYLEGCNLIGTFI